MSADLIALLVGMHMGALHPYEKVLTLVLAFGPFVVLGVVIAVRRRHEDDSQEQPSSEVLADANPAAGLHDERLAELVEVDVEDA